ncbi:MAG: ferritin-like domain-containing protein [Desulfurivibrionaceae bacterium]
MDTSQLIEMLNRDLADEHAATLRYLIHGYLEGEDTPMGASLLSRSREEMWHMHWLGMIIGHFGGEPEMKPAEYPYNPDSRSTILQSYIEYEENLVPHYQAEAAKVDDPHIRRVLEREAWESSYHAQKFRQKLSKLTPEEAGGKPEGERELSANLLEHLQSEVNAKYNEMLQHIRHAWVFQQNGLLSWEIMNQSMAKMKQLAHFAEDVAENGEMPDFSTVKMDTSSAVSTSLQNADRLLNLGRDRHLSLAENQELQGHSGLATNLDLTIRQEEYQAEEIESWLKKL